MSEATKYYDEKSLEGKTFQDSIGIWLLNRVWWNSMMEAWCDIELVEKTNPFSLIPEGHFQKLSVDRLQKEFKLSDIEQINHIMKTMGY